MGGGRKVRPVAGVAVAALFVAAAASCTATRAVAHPHHHAAARAVAHSRTVTVRAGKYAITLVAVSASGLGCTQTAQVVRYPVPCPTMLPPVVLGDYQGCLSAHQTHNWFMYAWVRGCGGPPEGWRGWMSASGGAAMSGTGLTVSDDQHFVMESVPFHTTDYDAVVYGPARYRLGRPRTARALGWITAGGRRMRWVLVSPQTSGSFMAGHLMLVWATRSHTYALGFHILPPGGQPVAAALDRAVASRLVMVRPGHQHPRAAGTAGG